ncbi:hypothetical protein PPIS_b0143 [Pseudoalteromonas piscicida]|uniref:Uncharacterized protein n=1 Tax=Pseudoalteromonas piscicida TaxID=43662 RepID=A0ABM6NK88_PSEO7|nr:hypothetical protein [Pseudoalteromonas piscicida]ATD09360.1 hypothetical protein PPIS_b0143 [Pseudoalteromonas piscicida]
MNKFFDNFYNYKGFGTAIKPVMPTEEILREYKTSYLKGCWNIGKSMAFVVGGTAFSGR